MLFFLVFFYLTVFFYNRQIEKYNFPVELLNSDKRRQQLHVMPNTNVQRKKWYAFYMHIFVYKRNAIGKYDCIGNGNGY